MTFSRGDVVLVDYPFQSGGGSKVRPAVVVQNDRDSQRLRKTIVAQISSVTRRSIEPTQVLIQLGSVDGAATGLRQDSVVNCLNLLAIEQRRVLKLIGRISPITLKKVETALKRCFDLP